MHLFGHPADVFNLEKICMKHSLYLIEDNAQATGSEFKGKKTGSFGDTGCLSFYPTKNLGAFGDGGMILTDNDELYAKLKLLRNHGSEDIYLPEGVGWNSRLDEIQAAILSVKLDHLNKWIIKRREISQWYTSLLSHEGVICPNEPLEGIHSFNQYVIRIKNRNEVKEHLNSLKKFNLYSSEISLFYISTIINPFLSFQILDSNLVNSKSNNTSIDDDISPRKRAFQS